MNRKLPIRFMFAGVLLLLCRSLDGQLPPDFYDQIYLDDFATPMGFTFDDNGRMYVWEKRGMVFIVDTDGQRLETPLINIREEVTNWQDHGLISIALHPEFLVNGYFYLLYAVDMHHYQYFGTPDYDPGATIGNRPTIGRVTRYQADAATGFTQVVEGSRTILLGKDLSDGIPILYKYHGLGSLVFGEDGSLLVSNGDATSPSGEDIGGNEFGTMAEEALAAGILSPDQNIGSYRSQYLGNLNGKILRIDPFTGDGIPNNPFFDPAAPRASWSRVWALGFRNPYRVSVVPGTGVHQPQGGFPGIIMAGDVGNIKWEELNMVTAGGQNFGWPLFEGVWHMEKFWQKATPENQLAVNPLYEEAGCENEFFDFRTLLHRPLANGEMPFFANPCRPGEAIPEAARPMVETLPLICYANARFNRPARSFVPAFNGEEDIIGLEISAEESPVEAASFMGWSSLAGLFYQGNHFPEKYRNKYFAVDFYGWIQLFDFDEDYHLLAIDTFHTDTEEIIHLMENPADGRLYYLNLDGEIHQISYGGDPAPIARISSDLHYGPGPLSVQFDGSASTDNGPIVSYHWDFGDGIESFEQAPNHTFNATQEEPTFFTIQLTVTDTSGASASTETTISLNNTPPRVQINSFRDGDRYPLNRTSLLMLDATVSDQEFPNEELTYEWRTFLHHNTHYHPDPPDPRPATHTLISPLGCGVESYFYRIELKVTDPAGLSSTDSRRLFPNCDPLFLEWTNLEGEYLGSDIELRWHTQMEDELDYFVIQRSEDLENFKEIGRVKSLVPASTGRTYQFTDDQPGTGSNVYRIKAVSKDQAFIYSNLLSLDYPNDLQSKIFPNPAGNLFRWN